MTTVLDIKTAIDKLTGDIATEKTLIAGELKTMGDKITALQAQIAAGTGVTSADLDAILAQINNVDTSVKAILVPAV